MQILDQLTSWPQDLKENGEEMERLLAAIYPTSATGSSLSDGEKVLMSGPLRSSKSPWLAGTQPGNAAADAANPEAAAWKRPCSGPRLHTRGAVGGSGKCSVPKCNHTEPWDSTMMQEAITAVDTYLA